MKNSVLPLKRTLLWVAFFIIMSVSGYAQSKQNVNQDKRSQLPSFMHNSYFEVNVGHISYPFSAEQLQPGYNLQSVSYKHPAVRLVLMGHQFNKYLSAQVTYMRPIWWVNYKYTKANDLSSNIFGRTVWMNIAGVTLRPQVPIGGKFSLYGESGLGLVTRNGFRDDENNVVVKDLVYATITFGAGLVYKLSDVWALQLVSSYTPAGKNNDQPYTAYIGTGFKYTFLPFSDERLEKAATLGRIHPKQWIQVSYSSNIAGYGVNNFMRKSYLFWGGEAEVKNGFMINYKRNIFHGPKVFALDVGVNASIWQTNVNREVFFALSAFPIFRFNFLHNKHFDPYFFYTLGGPTYISKYILDGADTGRKFTFYDDVGLGAFFGSDRRLNAELKIAHYSNGNIFPKNGGVKIPLTLSVGYCF